MKSVWFFLQCGKDTQSWVTLHCSSVLYAFWALKLKADAKKKSICDVVKALHFIWSQFTKRECDTYFFFPTNTSRPLFVWFSFVFQKDYSCSFDGFGVRIHEADVRHQTGAVRQGTGCIQKICRSIPSGCWNSSCWISAWDNWTPGLCGDEERAQRRDASGISSTSVSQDGSVFQMFRRLKTPAR